MNTLAAKIAKASTVVGALMPDKTNTAQNYPYISADKVLQRAGDALSAEGIVIFPSITSESVEQVDYTDNYGKSKSRFDSTVHFAMVISDGETQLELPWCGRGNDFSVPDKALYKAITSGHKYFLLKLLNIGVGNEDGEHEVSEDAQSRTGTTQKGATARPAPPQVQSSTQAPSTPQRPSAAVQGDVLFEKPEHPLASQAQLNKMHALGMAFHRTKEAWEQARPLWVEKASGGHASGSKELSPEQCDWVIAGLEKRIRETAQQPVAQPA